MLDCQKGRYDFPELKRLAMEEYKYWEPDMVLIEAKASGAPLTHELRRLGIPVVNYSLQEDMTKLQECTLLHLSLKVVWCMLHKSFC